MTITFSGLATGLDTASLVDQLVAIERAPANTLAGKQSDINAHKSIIGSLSSAVSALGTAARALDLDSELRPRSVAVSDSHLTAAVSAGATAAVHDVRVKQLAAAQIVASKTFATQAAGVLGTGGVDITTSGTTKSITWGATDSLDTIATRINDAGAGVSASVLYDGSLYRLMVVSRDTGTAAASTFVDSGDGLDLANPANVKIEAKDAKALIDNVEITRPKNVISDALAGVTLTLTSKHEDTDPAAKVTIGLDQKALTDKVKAVVSAWNSINSALHVQLDYTGTQKSTSTLFGDATLRQLQQSLGALGSKAYGDSNLSVIGITRDKTGAMTLDETKLAAAIAANPDAASNIFVKNGFSSELSSLADLYTTSSTGLFAGKVTALSARSKDLQKQIDRINTNADALQTRLQAQFGALEQAMSQLKTQSSFLTSMIG